MKIILLLLTIIISTHATRLDHIAFFYQDSRIVVLINEYDTDGRLVDLMNQLGTNDKYKFEQADFKMSCSQNYRGAACRFTFYPSDNIAIANRTLEASIPFNYAGEDFEIAFESSMNDKFNLRLSNDEIIMTGSKILGN
jgi:hypothetical protein